MDLIAAHVVQMRDVGSYDAMALAHYARVTQAAVKAEMTVDPSALENVEIFDSILAQSAPQFRIELCETILRSLTRQDLLGVRATLDNLLS